MLIVPIIYFVSFLNCELISHLLPYPTVSHCLSMYLAMLFQFLLLFSVIVFFHPFYSVICHYLIQSFLLYLFFFNFPYFWLIFNYRTLPPPHPFHSFLLYQPRSSFGRQGLQRREEAVRDVVPPLLVTSFNSCKKSVYKLFQILIIWIHFDVRSCCSHHSCFYF